LCASGVTPLLSQAQALGLAILDEDGLRALLNESDTNA